MEGQAFSVFKLVLQTSSYQLHCNENLCISCLGIARPQSHIHVSVSDLYISRIDPHISCSRIGRSIMGIYKSLTDTWMWKLGRWPPNSFCGNICWEFSVLVLCNVTQPHWLHSFIFFFFFLCGRWKLRLSLQIGGRWWCSYFWRQQIIVVFLKYTCLKVPSHQIRSAWKWYSSIGSHGY